MKWFRLCGIVKGQLYKFPCVVLGVRNFGYVLLTLNLTQFLDLNISVKVLVLKAREPEGDQSGVIYAQTLKRSHF